MLRKFIPHTGIVRNILTLFTGSAIAQAIPVLISPILTRLYPVTDFATLTVITTVITLLAVVVTGRYELSIGLPADDTEAKRLVSLTLVVTTVISLFFLIIIGIFRQSFSVFLNISEASNYLLLVPIAIFFYGFYQAYSLWHIRMRNYKIVAGSRVSQSLFNSGTSLALAFAPIGINGLIIGNVVGNIASFLFTLTQTRDRFHLFVKGKMEGLRVLASRYSDLPKVNSVHALTDNVQATAQVLIISAAFGSIATGLYGLTMRILQAPLNMLGSSLALVFYKEVSEKISKGQQITKLLMSTMRTLILISLPVFIILMIIGPRLFCMVFGEQWTNAGNYARILSPWLLLNFIASPLSNLPIILNRQRRFFLYSVCGNTAAILAIATGGYYFKDINSGLILLSVVQCIFQLAMLVFFIGIARKADRDNKEKSLLVEGV